MKVKNSLLGTMLLFTASSFAQESDVMFSSPKQIPQETQLLELASKLISYGRQSKSALPLIQAVQILKQLNVVDDTLSANKEKSPFSEKGLLSDAAKYADGNKSLLALVKDAEKTSRAGWQTGPIRHYSTIIPNGVDELKNWFQGGRLAQIVIDGQGEGISARDEEGNLLYSDLRLTVYDGRGRVIASDQTRGENCSVCFIPQKSCQLTIEVKNVGGLTDDYVLYIYNN